MIGSPTEAPVPSLAGVRTAALGMAASLLISILASGFAAPALASAWAGKGMDQDAIVLPLVGLGLILILLSSRMRSFVLRRVPGAVLDPGGEGLAAAYARASLLSFALLEAAGLLGCALSFLTGLPRYGVAFGAAGLLAMLTRWPREGELRRLLARRPRP